MIRIYLSSWTLLLQMGTDIEDTKCTWLIVQALQRADESQKKCLKVMCYLQCLVSCSMMWYDSSTIQVDEHGSFSDAQIARPNRQSCVMKLPRKFTTGKILSL